MSRIEENSRDCAFCGQEMIERPVRSRRFPRECNLSNRMHRVCLERMVLRSHECRFCHNLIPTRIKEIKNSHQNVLATAKTVILAILFFTMTFSAVVMKKETECQYSSDKAPNFCHLVDAAGVQTRVIGCTALAFLGCLNIFPKQILRILNEIEN